MSQLMNQARSRMPRIAEAAVERARLTVVPRAAVRRAGRVPFVTLVSLLLVGGVAGLLFFNTSMQQVSFTGTALEARAQALDAQQQGLQLELDALRNPQRVALAAKKMGMVPQAVPVFLRLGDGKVLGTPVPASVADAVPLLSRPTRKPRSLNPLPTVITPAKSATGALVGISSTAKNKASGGALAAGRSTANGTKKTHHR